MTEVVLDLFGQAVMPRREGRGRPPHVWSQENSNRINLLFACGRSPREAASAICISTPTLYKVYFNECAARRNAALKFRARQMERLNVQAEAGNVAAEKALAGMIQSERVAVMSDQVRDRGRSEPKIAALGKKESAKLAAESMAGRFATRPAPPQLIN